MSENIATRMNELALRGHDLSEVADAAEAWIFDAKKNSVTVQQQERNLLDTLFKVKIAGRRLALAARRRMCIGVFGPSQVGKSYLVNSFGKGGTDIFNVRLGDLQLDFLKYINPQNESESTGLVTRFTVATVEGEKDAPIRARLLSETDIVKCIFNSFVRDFKLEVSTIKFGPPTAQELRLCLDKMQKRRGAKQAGAPDRFAIHDLREYVNRIGGKRYAEAEASGYWKEAAELAEFLAVKDRAELLSPLWGGSEKMPEFTGLYLRLVGALEKLQFAEEASLGVEALVAKKADGGWERHKESVLNVRTLAGLGADQDSRLMVRAKNATGMVVSIDFPRSDVAALIAELQLALGENSFAFFKNADLLDFPGARGRKEAINYEDGGKGDKNDEKMFDGVELIQSATTQYFLRGKVEYLFHRYVEEREMTGMLLCFTKGNQEVSVLGDMVNEWVEANLGESPNDRKKNPNTLFLILTKSDQQFEDSHGSDVNTQKAKWGMRLDEGLLSLYGRYGWPMDWDGKPFTNSFWYRNPEFPNRNLMRYDESNREVGFAEVIEPKISQLRQFCVENEHVRRHFSDPGKAFDELLRFRDGGASYIEAELSNICKPDLKLQQVAARIDEQVDKLKAAFAAFYDPEGGDKIAAKNRVAQEVIGGLVNCVKGKRFGELIAYLQIHEDRVRSIYAGVSSRHLEENDDGETPVITSGAAIDNELMAALFGETANQADTKQSELGDARSTLGADRASMFVDELVSSWTNEVLSMPGDTKVRTHLMIDEGPLRKLVQELVKGFERTQQRDQLTAAVRAETNLATTNWDKSSERIGLVVRMKLGQFMSFLDLTSTPENARPKSQVGGGTRPVFSTPVPITDLPNLPERESMNQAFLGDWITAIRAFIVGNADFNGGGELTEAQNRELSAIMARIIPESAAP